MKKLIFMSVTIITMFAIDHSCATENIKIDKNKTIFFITSETIEFVDISNPLITGLIEEGNPHILRLKIDGDIVDNGENFDVTIVTERGLYNYNVQAEEPSLNSRYNKQQLNNMIKVNPNMCITLSSEKLDRDDFKKHALNALSKKGKIKNINETRFGLKYSIINIFTVGDYILLDIMAENKTNLQYDIADTRFRLEDNKLLKATVSQEIEIRPLFTLYDDEKNIIKPKQKYRNIYVFNKFTYPDQKVFIAEISETGISGRKVGVKINYNQLLSAKYLL